jgi:hypothetical protein
VQLVLKARHVTTELQVKFFYIHGLYFYSVWRILEISKLFIYNKDGQFCFVTPGEKWSSETAVIFFNNIRVRNELKVVKDRIELVYVTTLVVHWLVSGT